MFDEEVREGHPKSFGFLRRSELDAVNCRGGELACWEAPDGTKFFFPSSPPKIRRTTMGGPGKLPPLPGYPPTVRLSVTYVFEVI